jgi:hypothetical protein
MSTEIVSFYLKHIAAQRFKQSFTEDSLRNVGYIFIGKSTEYEDEETPEDVSDTLSNTRIVWDNMYAGKKITAGDVEFVIPNQQWESGKIYKQFDDQKDISDLLSISENYINGQNAYPMYVINSEGNVYKCLCNDTGLPSLEEPIGDFTVNDGFIYTSDNLLWKYMYNIRQSNKFLSDEWIPVPGEISDVNFVDYNLNQSNLVDGALVKIVVTNPGTNYFHSNITVQSFSSGETVLSVIGGSLNNVYENMTIEGDGIVPGTYIIEIDRLASIQKITLSNFTTGAGGGFSSAIQVKTRVVVEGDGELLPTTYVELNENNGLRKIVVSNYGVGYNYADVVIYGSGSDASARVVLPPKYGHGFDPAKELGAKSVMIVERIGEVDSTENGLISVETSFRQYGLLINPHKYGDDFRITEQTANSVITQTTNITLAGVGNPYPLDTMVYQGSVSKPFFTGIVNSQDLTTIRLTNIRGTPAIGSLLFSETDPSSGRAVFSVKNPELEPYTGDIVYIKNITKVERSLGQAEEIKFVIQF